MATIIKLLIAALLLNAIVHVSMAAFKYYQFEDAVHEALLFSPTATDAELAARITELAEERDVPIDASDITVSRQRYELTVEMSYDEDIALIPGLYTKTWTFTPTAKAQSLAAITVPKPKP